MCVWLLGSAKLQTLMKARFESTKDKLNDLIGKSRKVVICLDGWTKKGLSASFLGISAGFFDYERRIPLHTLLSLVELNKSQTGEMLSNCLSECLTTWDIPASKVLLIVSDNRANMVKAIRLLKEKERAQACDLAMMVDESDTEDETDEDDEDDVPLSSLISVDLPVVPEDVPYRRLLCMAHCLQLVIKEVYKHPAYETVIKKARHMVAHIRKSPTLMR